MLNTPRLTGCFVALTLSVGSVASAQQAPADAPTPPSAERDLDGFEVSLGSTIELPMGSLSEELGATVTLLNFRLGHRLTPQLQVAGEVGGIYGTTGSRYRDICEAGSAATPSDSNDQDSEDYGADGVACASFGATASVHARFDFREELPVGGVSPWVSMGIGYQYLVYKGSSGGSDELSGRFDGSVASYQLAMPRLGIDIRLSESKTASLFLSATLGHHTQRSAERRGLLGAERTSRGASGLHGAAGGGFAIVF